MVAVAACGNAVLTVKNRFYLYFQPFLYILMDVMLFYMLLFTYCYLAPISEDDTVAIATRVLLRICSGSPTSPASNNSQPNYSGRRPAFS